MFYVTISCAFQLENILVFLCRLHPPHCTHGSRVFLHGPLIHLCLPGLPPMSRCSSGYKCTSYTGLGRRVHRWKCGCPTRSDPPAHRKFQKIPYGLTQLERDREYCCLILFDIVEHSSVHSLASNHAKIYFLSVGCRDV